MKNMDVFATKEELEDIKKRSNRAGTTPMIWAGGPPRDPWHSVRQKIHEYALAHGLPDTKGFYGMHLETGEFLSNY